MSAVELCGRIGRHMRLGTMLGRSCVQTRLKSEDGMSFSEFCYPMFQAYDWLYLYQNFQCTFQVGHFLIYIYFYSIFLLKNLKIFLQCLQIS